MRMRGITVDYDAASSACSSSSYEEKVAQLQATLPGLWQKAYRKMAQSPTSIHEFSQHGFKVLFDRASELQAKGVVSRDRAVEDRIIVAYGRSASSPVTDRPCHQGHLLGAAGSRFGEQTDRPYLRGCVLGGRFDISLYPLYRDLDHERSNDCRDYRAMKRYCFENGGTFCFTRLIYDSRSWKPAAIEHGLLREDGSLWIHAIRNKMAEPRIPIKLRSARFMRRPSSESTVAD